MQLNILRGKIKEKNLRQEELAGMMGITQATLSHKLNGLTRITVEEAERLCDILEIDSYEERARIFLI